MAALSRPPTAHFDFVEAVVTFLNSNDASSMEKFRTRLEPFRTETRQVTIGGTTVSIPILVLEDEVPLEYGTQASCQSNLNISAASLSGRSSIGPDHRLLNPVNGFCPSVSQGRLPAVDAASYQLGDQSNALSSAEPILDDEFRLNADQVIDPINLNLGMPSDGCQFEFELAPGTCAFDMPLNPLSPSSRSIMSISTIGRAGVSGMGIDNLTGEQEDAVHGNDQTRGLLPSPSSSGTDERSITPFTSRVELSGLEVDNVIGDWEDTAQGIDLVQRHLPSPSSSRIEERSVTPSEAPARRNAKDPKITKRVSSKQKGKTTSPVQQIMFKSYIREDFLPFIEINLPYWKEHGLWYKSALSNPHQGDSRYESLETIYSCMCELGMRIDHDPIRKHAALVLLDSRYKEALEDWKSNKTKKCKQSTGIGRGDASAMIDNILSNMHPDWDIYDARRRSELRAKFHDERRYGKRWSILVASLGHSILFLYSAELAKIVRDTTVALEVLERVASNCSSKHPDTARLLQLMNPITQCLIYNGDIGSHDTDRILRQLQSWQGSRRISIGAFDPSDAN